ncbi:MAG: DUF302 domain-containing protein [Candidatus Hermodarchaeia archaeon]|jgi:uncharacterized protein (DUF302 family)
MVDVLKKKLNMGFDDAVNHVEAIVKEEGFSVLMVKPLHEIFKEKLGVKDYSRYTMICACGAKLAKAAMDVSRNMGLLYPCSFVVYEEGEDIHVAHVSIMKIGPKIGLASADEMQPVIKMTEEMVGRAWSRF